MVIIGSFSKQRAVLLHPAPGLGFPRKFLLGVWVLVHTLPPAHLPGAASLKSSLPTEAGTPQGQQRAAS